MPPLAPLRESALALTWAELIGFSGFGDVFETFVRASVGSWISFSIL